MVITTTQITMNCAYGVHPTTRVIVEFDNVYTLHDTIVEWIEIIDPFDHGSHSFVPIMSFCVNEMIPESFTGNVPVPTSHRYSIERDGGIPSRFLGRNEDCHFSPSTNLIVIPRDMFEEYVNIYSPGQKSQLLW